MTPGIYPHLPDDDYHKSPGISNSGLTVIREFSPAHYRAWKEEPREETEAKIDGRHLHLAIIQPHVFEARCAAAPKFDMRTNIGKAGAKEWIEAHPGQAMIEQSKFDRFRRVRDSVHSNRSARERLENIIAVEESIYALDPITGVLVKARLDIRHRGGISDLKSAADIRPEKFSRSLYDYGYFQQAAFYSDVHDWHFLSPPGEFSFIAFEKEPPFAVRVYEASPSVLRHGRDAYRGALDLYAECVANDRWPCYEEGVTQIDLPPYIEKRLDAADNDEIEAISYVE